MARLDGVRIGDRVVLSAAPGTILQTFAAAQACRVAGIADFYFDLPAQHLYPGVTTDASNGTCE